MDNPFSTYVNSPTYDTLVTVIKTYLNRHDQDTIDAIPMFINFAEKNILRQLRAPVNSVTKKFNMFDSGSDGGDHIFAPRDYLEMENMWVEEPKFHQLERVSWGTMCRLKNGETLLRDKMNSCSSSSLESNTDGLVPKYWALNGPRMYFYPSPTYTTKIDENGKEVLDTAQWVYLTYYSDMPELSPEVNDGRSKLLDLLPDVLAYYALAEGFRFVMEPERADQYEKLAKRGLGLVNFQIEAERQENDRFINKFG